MARFTIYLLLSIVIFLAGIVLGISNPVDEKDAKAEAEDEVTTLVDAEASLAVVDGENNKYLFMNKVASFFEIIVIKIYEFIIYILYSVAKLFTG